MSSRRVCRFYRISKLANVRLRILPKFPAKIDIVCNFKIASTIVCGVLAIKPTFAVSDELDLCLILPWCRVGDYWLAEVHWFRNTISKTLANNGGVQHCL